MKIVHRIGLNLFQSQIEELLLLGIRPPAGIGLPSADLLLYVFEVEDDHPNISKLFKYFQSRDAVIFSSAIFSNKEINSAKWLELLPSWHCGYPQPDDDNNGYLETTYDLSEYCELCGMGLIQKAPFQMKGEPKWGTRGILQMNWIFDQYFVTPKVWEEIFKPYSISCRPVTNRKGVELKTVVQLNITEEVPLDTDGLQSEICKQCSRIKFIPDFCKPFPKLKMSPNSVMFWSHEFFGRGASSHHAVIIAQDLAKAISLAKIRGTSMVPVSPGLTKR